MPTDSQRGRDGLARDSVVRGELGIVVGHIPMKNPVDIFHFHFVTSTCFVAEEVQNFLILVMKG